MFTLCSFRTVIQACDDMQQAQSSDSFCPERKFKMKEAPASRAGTHTGPLKEKIYQKLSVYMEALEWMSGAALIRNDITV